MNPSFGKGDLALGTARDDLVLAERGVKAAEEEVAEREADLLALDGVLSRFWTTLTGSREQEIEAAAGRVAQSRQRLAHATANLTRARAAMDEVQQAAADRDARDREAAAARQARLDEAAAAGGPEGERARAIRLERGLLAERVAALEAAGWAGSDLLAVISTVANEGAAINRRVSGDLLGQAAAHRPGQAMARFVQSELVGAAARGRIQSATGQFAARAEAFRDALAAVGASYTPREVDGPVASPELGLVVNGLLGELALAASADQLAQSLVSREAEIQDLLIPLDRELRELRAAVRELDREEAELAGVPPDPDA